MRDRAYEKEHLVLRFVSTVSLGLWAWLFSRAGIVPVHLEVTGRTPVPSKAHRSAIGLLKYCAKQERENDPSTALPA